MPFSTGAQPQAVAVVDFNDDKNMDLAVASTMHATLNVLLGYVNGSFRARMTHSTSAEPDFITIGDFNGDD